MANKKQQRSDITLWIAIALGLVLGFFLKRVRFGFLFGLALGIFIVYLARKKRI